MKGKLFAFIVVMGILTVGVGQIIGINELAIDIPPDPHGVTVYSG